MDDYKVKLKDDLAEQFRDKLYIDSLMDVVGKQLNDLALFFTQLKSNRSMDTAVGRQLDGVGDIVSMTRADAAKLVGNLKSPSELTDAQYRQYLIYKVLKNTCQCTYYDLMESLKMFFGEAIRYSESLEKPATISLSIQLPQKEDATSRAVVSPIIKPAGVGVEYLFLGECGLSVGRTTKSWTHKPDLCATIRCGQKHGHSTLGYSTRAEMTSKTDVNAYAYFVDRCGVLPSVSTLGLPLSKGVTYTEREAAKLLPYALVRSGLMRCGYSASVTTEGG